MVRRITPNNRTRSTLIFVILGTLPCYCLGLVVLRSCQPSAQTLTPTVTQTVMEGTLTPPMPSNTPFVFPTATFTPTATVTWTPSLTFTPFVPPTRTITPTATFTLTPEPSETPTETLVPTETLTEEPDSSPTP
ncbi:MAG: hypothetical protein GYA59_11855 [Chloroflexi bacterium]|nr:hypothetical protein [Chloroflexota bacterium]